jgi:excisionase family DNA binding protein
MLDAIAGRVAALLGGEHQQHQQQQWLDVEEAAEHLRCSDNRVYRLVHLRRIPHHKEGRRLLFDRHELNEWVRKGGAKRVAR